MKRMVKKSIIGAFLLKNSFLAVLFFLGLVSCSDNVQVTRTLKTQPIIFPDYTNVTVPVNMAPLRFRLSTIYVCDNARVIIENEKQRFAVTSKKGLFLIPLSPWKKLMKDTAGSKLRVTVQVKQRGKWASFQPFFIFVAREPIDATLVYRLIEPGYHIWKEMGIYQRNLENFSESVIINNKRTTGHSCINCHSFCMQNPEKMLFHIRAAYSGTLLIDGVRIEKLNTKTAQTISALAYPSWHPSGNYVAFSVNDTKQSFHTADPNRVEVYDQASDVVVYDVNNHEIVTSPLLSSALTFETFPTFSPDGKTLFFCSAKAQKMPDRFESVKYSLCSISFDSENRRFGSKADTLYHADSNEGRSVSFPRVSPDGKFLMFTLSDYGNFSIWHKSANLHMIDLQSGRMIPLDVLNSEEAESYHSWSSNSRWVVFSSRRIDGLYTRPFIAYIDPEGKASKPFLLPQKDVDYYHRSLMSYNIPEFVTGKVKLNSFNLSNKAINDKGIDVKFSGK